MDLIRLLRSLEEFLYELIGWFVFYPRTFWRIVFHPGRMALYARTELGKEPDARFKDTISPVLMLILSVVVAHVLELLFHVPLPTTTAPAGQLLIGSEQGLVLTRSATFCVLALGAALGTLVKKREAITRDSLREPFSIQAFLVSPFLVLIAAGTLGARSAEPSRQAAGTVVIVLALLWYVGARATAYRSLYGGGWLWPLLSVCGWFLLTAVLIVAAIWFLFA